MQSHAVHDAVHNESRTCHVAAVLQQRNKEEQNQNLRQEYEHTAHAADDTVNDQIFEDAVRHSAPDPFSNPADALLNPSLRIGAQGKCRLKH